MSTDDFNVKGYPRVFPQIPSEIMDYGRHYNGDKPPEPYDSMARNIPNPTKNVHAPNIPG